MPKQVDILIDGSPIDVFDVTNDTLIAGGVGLLCDGATVYRFADGTAYQSLEFTLDEGLQETDTAVVYVSDGAESIELATPTGAFVPGPTGVLVNSVGATVQGEVFDGEIAPFRIKLSVASSEGTSLNQRHFSLRVVSEGS
jgi:hypothetical protein